MDNAFFFDTLDDLIFFMTHNWDENIPIKVEKRLTQYVVVAMED